MKTIAAILIPLLLSGCQLLSAIGLGTPQDVLPSLKYCDDVSYIRKGNLMEVRASCKMPVGS